MAAISHFLCRASQIQARTRPIRTLALLVIHHHTSQLNSAPDARRRGIFSDAENVGKFENLESVEDEDMKLAVDRWKSKSYALTVALRIVALEGSVPPVCIREFLRSQGKRVRFRPEFRRSVGDIFNELSNPFTKGKINPKSAVAADLVSLGDSWLNFAIGKGLIEPLEGAEEQDWFQEIIPGASPISLKPSAEQPREHSKGRPKLETNLIANIPPAEIMSRCELLEPLSEDALSDYTWLIRSLKKPEQGIMNRLRLSLSSLVPPFWSKMQSKAA